MNEVFLDTETTGLSFKDGHRIVEIACVETQDLLPTGKIFHRLIVKLVLLIPAVPLSMTHQKILMVVRGDLDVKKNLGIKKH